MFCYSSDILNGTSFKTDFIISHLENASDEALFCDYLFFKSIDDNLFELNCDGVYMADFEIMFFNYCILLCEEMAKRYFNKCVFEEVY